MMRDMQAEIIFSLDVVIQRDYFKQHAVTNVCPRSAPKSVCFTIHRVSQSQRDGLARDTGYIQGWRLFPFYR